MNSFFCQYGGVVVVVVFVVERLPATAPDFSVTSSQEQKDSVVCILKMHSQDA